MYIFVCILLLLQTTGCGADKSGSAKGGNKQETQSQQEQDKPIDTQLIQQMKMYKDIKQHEYEEAEKQRKLDKEMLKKMEKEKQSDNKNKKK